MIKDQPADLAYAPASYPRHRYTGRGTIVDVYVGSRLVGHLTRQGDAVGWDGAPPPGSAEAVVSQMIIDALRLGASSGRPLDDTWKMILDMVSHEDPREGDLAIW